MKCFGNGTFKAIAFAQVSQNSGLEFKFNSMPNIIPVEVACFMTVFNVTELTVWLIHVPFDRCNIGIVNTYL